MQVPEYGGQYLHHPELSGKGGNFVCIIQEEVHGRL